MPVPIASLTPGDEELAFDLLRLCKASASLTKAEQQLLPAAVEGVMAVLRNTALDLVAQSPGQAVMYGFACDGTPLRVASRQVSDHKGRRTWRGGKVLGEFLLQSGGCPDQGRRLP